MPTLNESFSVPNPSQTWAIVSDLNKLVPWGPNARGVSAARPSSVQPPL